MTADTKRSGRRPFLSVLAVVALTSSVLAGLMSTSAAATGVISHEVERLDYDHDNLQRLRSFHGQLSADGSRVAFMSYQNHAARQAPG
ncbi:MAG: hypothetical protein HKO82_10350, partial [Acidimicrobiia bacterium]|nr:hypothetical protein [Acidimicrobiia bacterium]